MAQDLNQVPPNLEVWNVAGQFFLVRMIPDTDPPIPLAWRVSSDEEKQALGITKADRTFSSFEEFHQTGALRHGNTTELINTSQDPWEQIQSNFETEVRVKPWLADPEILSLWYASALEGRSITDAELQGTEWWRTHAESERQWLSLNASDPATAERLIQDNRSRVSNMLSGAGVDNASQELINTVADNWTTGSWSEIYATEQIRMLADPQLGGSLDPALRNFRFGLDTTRAAEDQVRDLVSEWLGPAIGQGWSDRNIESWASKLREDPDARLELTEILRRQRQGVYPEYAEHLSYEDIAAPWRGVWSQEWGGVPDESSPLFMEIVQLNNLTEARKRLRQEGRRQGNPTVVQNLLGDMSNAFGSGVRRADPAVR